MNKVQFNVLYAFGIIVGIVLTIIKFEAKYLFFIGVGHLFVLLIVSWLLVQKKHRSESGRTVQFAGYIWTLIGIGYVLWTMDPKQSDSFHYFLSGAGVALVTSILGWTFGRLLEDRGEEIPVSSVRNEAEELARMIKKLTVDLKDAGELLIRSIKDTADNFQKMEVHTSSMNKNIQDLSKNLETVSSTIQNSLDTASKAFKEISGTATTININMKDSLTGLNQMNANLNTAASESQKLVIHIGNIIKQAKDVINHTGNFIHTVFGSRP